MSIPLSKLINFTKMATNPRISQNQIEYIRKYGEMMERGQMADVSPQQVQQWREVCWNSIASMFKQLVVEMKKNPSAKDTPAIVMLPTLAEYILKGLEVEISKENFEEFMLEVQKRA